MTRLRWNLALVVGGALTAVLVLAALLSLVWTPEPPTRVRVGLRLRAPLQAGLLGTDHFGRDVASMLMAGAWNSLSVAWPAVLLGAAIGIAIGSAAAALKGILDEVAMRACDVVFAFPAVLSAIMIGALIGSGPAAAVLAIAVFNVPVFARVTRAVALQVWTFDYVAAARALGKHPLRIAVEEVMPNIAGVLIVQATIQLAIGLTAEAALSYLGLGAQPPAASWGRMLADGQTLVAIAPRLVILPGLALLLSVAGANLLAAAIAGRAR